MSNVPVLITRWLQLDKLCTNFCFKLSGFFRSEHFIIHSAYIKYFPACKHPTIELNTLNLLRESSDKHICGENVTNIIMEEISKMIKCETEDGIHLGHVTSAFRNMDSDGELEQKFVNIQVSEKINVEFGNGVV